MPSRREREARAISMKVKTPSRELSFWLRVALVSLPVRVTSHSPAVDAVAFLCSFYPPARRCFYVTRSRERKLPRVEVNILLSCLTTNAVAIDYQTVINVSDRGNARASVRLARQVFFEIPRVKPSFL